MKEIKLKALVGDEVYIIKDFKIYKGTINKIIISDKDAPTIYVGYINNTLTKFAVPILGTSKEDLIEELTKLINECKL